MAVGAPAHLVAGATRAQADEIRHARTCIALASTLRGEELGLGALNPTGSMPEDCDVLALLIDTIEEACINETISAAQCQAAGDAARDPVVAKVLHTIAEDEQRHAALAWSTVRWILDEHPALHSAATKVFEDALKTPWRSEGTGSSDLTPWGVLSQEAEAAVADRVIRRVIRPCMNALLGTPEQVASAHE